MPATLSSNTSNDSFLTSLARYYANFLETDFKSQRKPKRRFATKDAGKLTGVRLSSYPNLVDVITKKLQAQSPSPIKITPRKYTNSLSRTLQITLQAAVDELTSDSLKESLAGIERFLLDAVESGSDDIELIEEQAISEVERLFLSYVSEDVALLIGHALERVRGTENAIGELVSHANDLMHAIVDDHLTELSQAIVDFILRKDSSTLNQFIESVTNIEYIQRTAESYFSDVYQSDAYDDVRTLLNTTKITQGTQLYLYVGDLRSADKSETDIYPIFYIPIDCEYESGTFTLELHPHIYVHKKAVDHFSSLISKSENQHNASELRERILHCTNDLSINDCIHPALDSILATLQLNDNIDFAATADSTATNRFVRASNRLYLHVCDKSDESIINDYEAITTGLEGGAGVFTSFSELIESIITQNPVSVEQNIENIWDSASTPDHLVYEAPLPLAEEQRKVLYALHDSKARFIAVEGPPGTGKSHTISAIAFETILKSKNVLILSDKNEALDVVESKLNDVINKVRGDQEEFVNPILRLGKNNSNFSNIVKKNSIEKIKTSIKTFNEKKQHFEEERSNLTGDLKTNIQTYITTAEAIDMKLIAELSQRENALYNQYECLAELTVEEAQTLQTYCQIVQALWDHEDTLRPILADGPLIESIIHFKKLGPALEAIQKSNNQNIIKLLRAHKESKAKGLSKLRSLADEVESCRMIIFGYLFAGRRIRELAQQIADILGKHYEKPQDHLDKLRKLAQLPSLIRSNMESQRCPPELGGLAFRFLKANYQPNHEVFAQAENLKKIDIELLQELSLPTSINEFFEASAETRHLVDEYLDISQLTQQVTNDFMALPDFDFYQRKSQLESLHAVELTTAIDERVVDFCQSNRTDARILAQIIRNKDKFPVDKFKALHKAFPCMIAGLRDYAEFIPLEPELFDLVIIDEASQVSIAQALPAILRSKKMIVMGDRRQFGNVKTSNASKEVNASQFGKVQTEFLKLVGTSNADLDQRCKQFNISKSVMDFFELVSNFSIQLKKHFRGYPEMISFSSDHFYDHSLQTLKIRGRPINEVLEFVNLPNQESIAVVDNTNTHEASYIIGQLEELLDREDPPSVAVITPFTKQQRLISRMVNDHPRWEEFQKKLKLAIFTFDSCQGEERDYIYYSFVANEEHDRLNYIFPIGLRQAHEDVIDENLKYQRLNVGFSRGKEKLIFVLSKPAMHYKGSLKEALMHYQREIDQSGQLPKEEDLDARSPMERDVLHYLQETPFYREYREQMEVIAQFDIGSYLRAIDRTYNHPNYRTDFLLRITIDDDVHQIIIEYDGFEHHFQNHDEVHAGNWQHYLTESDVERELTLESYGYKMLRINRFNLGDDPIETLDERLYDVLDELCKKDEINSTLRSIQVSTSSNIAGLNDKSRRECRSCKKILPLVDFYDPKLKSKYGRICNACKKKTK